MSLNKDLMLSARNLLIFRGNRLTPGGAVRAVLVVAFSLLPILVVLEVTSGMIEGITRRYVEVESGHLQLRPYGGTSDEESSRRISELVSSIDGVTHVSESIEGIGLIFSDSWSGGVRVRGVVPEYYHDNSGIQRFLVFSAGGFYFGKEDRGVLISEVLATHLGVGIGDTVRLLTSRSSQSGISTIPRITPSTVGGIFTTGYRELDLRSIYIHKATADKLFSRDGKSIIRVNVSNHTEGIDELKGRLRRTLPPSWGVLTWLDLNYSLFRNLQSTKTMLLVIMSLIVLVAITNVSSTLYSLVVEQQLKIAILKCIGESPHGIVRQFILAGFLIGIFGITIGFTLGLFVAININPIIQFMEIALTEFVKIFTILFPFAGTELGEVTILLPEYYLEEIPIVIPVVESVSIAVGTLLLVIMASLFPAARAGKIKPLSLLHGK